MSQRAYAVWFVGITLLLSLFLFIYAMIQIVTEKRDQEQILADWEVELTSQQQDEELELDRLIEKEPVIKISNPSQMKNSRDKEDINRSINRSSIEVIGKLTIPKINIKWAVVEGTSKRELAKGVGHYIGSAMPGEQGNMILAGHRESGFKRIEELDVGDPIEVETRDGTYTYEVSKTMILDKEDKSIKLSSDQSELTLITCYPLDYIGPAPNRYIIIAQKIP